MVSVIWALTVLVVAGLAKHELAARRRYVDQFLALDTRVGFLDAELKEINKALAFVQSDQKAYEHLAGEVSKLSRKVNGEAIAQKLGR